jgi:hypothetical protein
MSPHTCKKSLTIVIIILFIGIVAAPNISLNIVNASNDNDLVEVTSQACGIQGFGNTTVKLTKEQYQNLESYLVDFRARLNQTTTREEAVPLFKEVVVELNKYGLLPKGMSVEKAQTLITGRYQNKNKLVRLEKLCGNSISDAYNNSNYFCFVAGKASDVTFFGFPFRSLIYSDIMVEKLIVSLHSPFLIQFLTNLYWSNMGLFSSFLGNIYGSVLLLLHGLFPLKIFSCISFGIYGQGSGTYSSIGWIYSAGFSGIKLWNNSFTGNIIAMYFQQMWALTKYFIGVTGFTGISIMDINNNAFFLGTALHVSML